MLELLKRGPVPLAWDNFTPAARTPWGGTRVGARYKARLLGEASAARVIGESWEFSAEPSFPSKVLGRDETLADVVARHPREVLSPSLVARGVSGIELLVKIVDAGDSLSLQVHPADETPTLAPGECGKPESWLVLDAAPGAGIYLGFARALDKAELRRLLAGGDVASALQFHPVRPGDYFEILPGVPHAIGAGVTLLEPQRVAAGKSGKTYRMWDWDRRYDAAGQLDALRGEPRELHVEESLALVDPAQQVGAAFVASLMRRPEAKSIGALTVLRYPANAYYQLVMLEASAPTRARLEIDDGYAAMLVLDGVATFAEATLAAGQPALLPHAASPVRADFAAGTRMALVFPASARLSVREAD
jgi:mannose-6-phosphate isomerase